MWTLITKQHRERLSEATAELKHTYHTRGFVNALVNAKWHGELRHRRHLTVQERGSGARQAIGELAGMRKIANEDGRGDVGQIYSNRAKMIAERYGLSKALVDVHRI